MAFIPSHRNPNDLQPEVCDLCGNLVGHQHLLEADVEGLRGFNVCDLHRFERRARVAPSFRDIQAESALPEAPEAGQRVEPLGGLLWYEDAGAILREDGTFLMRENVGLAFDREAL